MQVGVRPEMPFAEQGRPISRLLQAAGEELFVARKSHGRVIRDVEHIPLVSEALRLSAGEHARATRTAHREAYISGIKANTLGGNPVDVRRGDILTSVEPDIGITQVVGHDQDNIGAIGRLCTQAGTGQ